MRRSVVTGWSALRSKTNQRESQNGMGLGTCSMTTQIAVRLPDELVNFLDRSVAEDIAASRAALVSRAVEREMRRQAALADVAILSRQGTEDDLDALVSWSAANSSFED